MGRNSNDCFTRADHLHSPFGAVRPGRQRREPSLGGLSTGHALSNGQDPARSQVDPIPWTA